MSFASLPAMSEAPARDRRAVRPLALLMVMVSLAVSATQAQARDAHPASRFAVPLSAEHQIVHALNRLTFGSQPGDVARVRAMGLKKWIALQLHPERIPENPVLAAKLQPLGSLQRDSTQLVLHFPQSAML